MNRRGAIRSGNFLRNVERISYSAKKNLQHIFCAAETKFSRYHSACRITTASLFCLPDGSNPGTSASCNGKNPSFSTDAAARSKKQLRGEIHLALLPPFQQPAALWKKCSPSGRSPSMHFISLILFYHVLTDMSIFILTKFLQFPSPVLYNFNDLTQQKDGSMPSSCIYFCIYFTSQL